MSTFTRIQFNKTVQKEKPQRLNQHLHLASEDTVISSDLRQFQCALKISQFKVQAALQMTEHFMSYESTCHSCVVPHDFVYTDVLCPSAPFNDNHLLISQKNIKTTAH